MEISARADGGCAMRQSGLTPLCTAHAIFWLLLPVACSLSPTIDAPGVSKLSDGPFEEISWSPEGSLILAIGAPPAPNTQSVVKKVGYPSGEVAPLTRQPSQYSNGSWSPDGSRVAITVDFDRIGIRNADDGTLSLLFPGEAAAWLPDGSRLLVYTGQLSAGTPTDRRLRTINAAGETVSDIALTGMNGAVHDSAYDEFVSALSLSRDGSQAAFGLFVAQAGKAVQEAYVADAASGAARQLLPDQRAGFPAWDPSRDRIAYIRYDASDLVGELVIAQADGTCIFKPALPSEISHFSWSPDGSKIAFLYHGAIFVLDLEAARLEGQGDGGC